MKAIPQLNPSRPSSQLKEFVTPTIQKTVMNKLRKQKII